MSSSEKHVEKFEKKLRRLGAKLDKLVTKAEAIDAKAKVDYHERIDKFRTRQHAALHRLAAFNAAGGEKWGQFMSRFESAWSELEGAFKELKHQSKR